MISSKVCSGKSDTISAFRRGQQTE
jgi:hypothetical protein